jgi:hypothetical protein
MKIPPSVSDKKIGSICDYCGDFVEIAAYYDHLVTDLGDLTIQRSRIQKKIEKISEEIRTLPQ